MQRKPYAVSMPSSREQRRAEMRAATKQPFTPSAAAMSTRPLTPNGHLHTEAFCLMWYACECGHRERIWNSRDGVTPFGFQCPSCKEPKLRHVNWNLDQYAPKHVPAPGQRVWIDLTRDRALEIARRTVNQVAKGNVPVGTDLNRIADAVYNEGRAPDLVVYGYVEAV
ncbi:hypothetical protein [Paraburkholderia sp. BL17N1]|uniref:hypothetical protein n=1 Tax=Paraburkholderia sp. BL17N1 TaxID=1938798 RepID=UPI000EB1C6CD|nr:hypothetical protein [Paraburkholderia sp. BL17N1]RKR46267.1 hypothetical protein B0G82_3949 [Paraburkholderia sp. BL17N1]